MAMGRRRFSTCLGVTIDYLEWSAPTSLASLPTDTATGDGDVSQSAGGGIGSAIESYQDYTHLKWEDAVLAPDDCVYVIPSGKVAATGDAPILRFNPDNSITTLMQVSTLGSVEGAVCHNQRNKIYWVTRYGSVGVYDIASSTFDDVPPPWGMNIIGAYPMICADNELWMFRFQGVDLIGFRMDASNTFTQINFTRTGTLNNSGGIEPGHGFALHPWGSVFFSCTYGVAEIDMNTHNVHWRNDLVNTATGKSQRVLPDARVLIGGSGYYVLAYNPDDPTSGGVVPIGPFSYSFISTAVGCNGNVFGLSEDSLTLIELNCTNHTRTVYFISNTNGGSTKWRRIVQRSDNTLVVTPGSGNTFAVVSLPSAPPSGWQHSPYVVKR